MKKDNGILTLPYVSKVGYEQGSRLNLLYKDSSSQYFKILNPVSLAFRKPDGNCRTVSDDAANSFVDLKFG